MLNKVIIMGRLTKDPDLKNTQSGVAMCRFSVAVERQFKDKVTGERQTDFLDCTAFRGTAEFISRYFAKGNMILVEGNIQNNNYTDNNGVKHYSNNIMVENVSFCGGKMRTAQHSPIPHSPLRHSQTQALSSSRRRLK
jgi:single-strand DNA-binding protein